MNKSPWQELACLSMKTMGLPSHVNSVRGVHPVQGHCKHLFWGV